MTLSGEIDIATTPLLADALCLAEALAAGMVLDLGGVEFIDSCGALLLLETARRVRARGDRFAFEGASDVVTRLLHLMGVEDTLASRSPSFSSDHAIAGSTALPPSTVEPTTRAAARLRFARAG